MIGSKGKVGAGVEVASEVAQDARAPPVHWIRRAICVLVALAEDGPKVVARADENYGLGRLIEPAIHPKAVWFQDWDKVACALESHASPAIAVLGTERRADWLSDARRQVNPFGSTSPRRVP
ncbi:MAG: hypothetical protein AAGF78_02295 [Pseudomonadota bacterium]